jgi:UMF1 family MFS transporter
MATHDELRGVSITTDDELRGFYSFGIATEIYSYMALAVFFPIILDSMTTSVANLSHPCNSSERGCTVPVFGLRISTTALVFYATAIAVFLQFIVYMSLGALADYGIYRKTLMLAFGYSTCIIGFCMLFVVDIQQWWMAYLIFIGSSVSFGASYVFYYSYVPILTRNHPKLLKQMEVPTEDNTFTTALLNNDSRNFGKASEAIANEISSKGFGFAFLSALILFAIFVVLSLVLGELHGFPKTYGLHVCISLSCVWGAVILYFYTNRLVKSRPGPPLPNDINVIQFSCGRLLHTLWNLKRLPELLKFLIAWFFYSDGFTTISSCAILFAQSQLGASTSELVIAAFSTLIAAVIGAFLWPIIQQRLLWTTRQVLILQSSLYCILPIYGLFSFHTTAELFVLAACHGFLVAATQSSCRVFFGELLPVGSEAEFFAVYELTDKGSAWLGPLIIGLLQTSTGDLRNAFWLILIFFLLPICLFATISEDKGKSQATEYVNEFIAMHTLLDSD